MSDRRSFRTSHCSTLAAAPDPADPARRAFLAVLSVAAVAGPCSALATGAGRGFPTSVTLTPGGVPLLRTGSGRFRFFFVPYYDCALYAAPGLKDAQTMLAADAPRRFVIDALRQITAFEFIWGLDQGLADNTPRAELKLIASDIERLRVIVREVGGLARGMRGALDYVPGTGVRLLLNDAPQGPALGGKALADALFKIWLGERPLDDALKEALFAG